MTDVTIGAIHVLPNIVYHDIGYIIGEPTEDPATGVYELDQPIDRRVTLWHKRSLRPLAQTLSLSTGYFRFDGVRDDEYFVTAWDHERDFNAVIQDFVRPTFD